MATHVIPAPRSPLHDWHARQGAGLIDRAGWLVPDCYRDLDRELQAGRTGAALVDLSSFAKGGLQGVGSDEAASSLFGQAEGIRPRQVCQIERGDPMLICRPTPERFFLMVDSQNDAALQQIKHEANCAHGVVYQDLTSAIAAFGLIGPKVESVLARLASLDVRLRSFPPGNCAETALAQVHALLVRPPAGAIATTYICVAWDVAEYVWERVLEAGQDEACMAIGMKAWRLLVPAAAVA